MGRGREKKTLENCKEKEKLFEKGERPKQKRKRGKWKKENRKKQQEGEKTEKN